MTEKKDEIARAEGDEHGDGALTLKNLETLLSRLSETISRIETSSMDENERARFEATKNLNELAGEKERMEQEARGWERRYKDTLARQLLADAAAAGGAYRPEQVVSLLSGKISWSEDGKDPVLTLSAKDGQPAVYERNRFLEAVKAFLAENPNLASSGASGGAGSKPSVSPVSSGGALTLADLRRMRPQLEEQARQFRK